MEQVRKQCFGIDISKLDFTVCLVKNTIFGKNIFSDSVKFDNNKTGFNQLLKWARKNADASIETVYLMEATGVYYEPLAYHLHRLKQNVSVILPNKVKHFTKSLNIKTKTDSVDARIIGQLGVERKVSIWTPPAGVYKQLKDVTRLCNHLKKSLTACCNRTESLECGEISNSFILKSNKKMITELKKQISNCENEIKRIIKSDKELARKVSLLETIKGVGFTTITVIVAETQGFSLINSRKQLASYAGYDIVQRESGTSVKGKTKISKKGNSRIRAALYFPAMVATNCNSILQEDYLRIIGHNSSKMIGLTAIQRKLLLLMYTLWKNDDTFKDNYELNKNRK